MSEPSIKEVDITATEIVDNFQKIANELGLIKHTMIKLLSDVNYCVVCNETIANILEEAEIAGPDEIPATVDGLIKDRNKKADRLFKKIMNVTKEFSKQSQDMIDLQKIFDEANIVGKA